MRTLLKQSACNPGQWKLLKSTAWSVLLAGGNGSGKTTGLNRKVVQLGSINRGVDGLVIAQSYRALWSVVYRNMTRQFNATYGRKRTRKLLAVKDKQGECYLDWGGGGAIFLRTATHPSGVDGLDVGWLAGDELRYWPRDTFTVANARVRRPCPLSQRVFSSTPSVGFMSEEFSSGKPNRLLIRAPTVENAHNLAPGYIDELRRTFSARTAQALIDGFFVPHEGAVYEQLSPDIWNSEHAVTLPSDWLDNTWENTTYLAVDPGFRRSAWVWIRKVGPCQWVIFDELIADNKAADECVVEINRRGHPIDQIWCDPAAGQRSQATGLSVLQVLHKINTRGESGGVRTIPPGSFWSEISFGVERVRSLLDWCDLQTPVPRLRFATSLREVERNTNRGVVKDHLAYSYPDPTKSIAKRLDDPMKDSLTDHFPDAVRYWAVGMYMTEPALRAQIEAVRKMREAA